MSFDCKINLVSAISHFFHTHHTFEVKVMKFISYTNNIKVYLVKRHQHNFIYGRIIVALTYRLWRYSHIGCMLASYDDIDN